MISSTSNPFRKPTSKNLVLIKRIIHFLPVRVFDLEDELQASKVRTSARRDRAFLRTFSIREVQQLSDYRKSDRDSESLQLKKVFSQEQRIFNFF